MRRFFAVAVASAASALSVACASILGIEDTVAPADSGPRVDASNVRDADASDGPVTDAAADTSTIDAACSGACKPFTSGPCVLACKQTASDIATGPNNTVVWINTGSSGGVISADESTGVQQPLTSTGLISPNARIATSGSLVFYTDAAVLRVVKNNTPIDMTTASAPITSIAVAGTRLGYTFGANVSACGAAYAACNPTPIGSNLSGNAGGIVGDSNQDLYWFTTAVQMWWCTTSSCPNNFMNNAEALVGLSWNTNTKTLYALGAANNAFVVTPWTLPNTKSPGLIGQGSAKAITAAGDHLYVASTNGVQRSIAGGAFSQMVAGSPSAIAADDVWVVWVEQDKIMRAPR